MKKYISKFHFITQDLPQRSHLEQTRMACEAGANWIQYRCLTKNNKELIAEINDIAVVCDDWGATLILTQHYHLLDQVDAHGVHMENLDTNFKAVRSSIGEEKTLGGSAANPQELLALQEDDVDYAFYGPFNLPENQPNKPILLGFDGYKGLKELYDIKIPVIAVGGIKPADIAELLLTDILGIGASEAINLAHDPTEALKEMYYKIH